MSTLLDEYFGLSAEPSQPKTFSALDKYLGITPQQKQVRKVSPLDEYLGIGQDTGVPQQPRRLAGQPPPPQLQWTPPGQVQPTPPRRTIVSTAKDIGKEVGQTALLGGRFINAITKTAIDPKFYSSLAKISGDLMDALLRPIFDIKQKAEPLTFQKITKIIDQADLSPMTKELWKNVESAEFDTPILNTTATMTLLAYGGIVGIKAIKGLANKIQKSAPQMWRMMTIKERGLVNLSDTQKYEIYKAMPGDLKATALRNNRSLFDIVRKADILASQKGIKPTPTAPTLKPSVPPVQPPATVAKPPITRPPEVPKPIAETPFAIQEGAGKISIPEKPETFIKAGEQLARDFTGIVGKPPSADRLLGKPKPEIINIAADKALSAQIRAEVRGSRTGFKEGIRITKEQLIEKLRTDTVQMNELKNHILDQIKADLPKGQREGFLAQLRNDISRRKATQISLRIMDKAQDIRRVAVEKEVREFRVPKRGVSADYQRRIIELKREFDFKKMSPRAERRLKGLTEFLKRNPDMLIQHPDVVRKLGRLSKKPIASMTNDEVTELSDTLNLLEQLGRTKFALKNKYDERVKEVKLIKLINSTHDIDPSVTGKIPQLDQSKIYINKYHTDTMNAPRVFDRADGYKKYRGENVKLIKDLIKAEIDAEYTGNEKGLAGLEEIRKVTGIDDWTKEMQAELAVQVRLAEGETEAAIRIMESNNMGDLEDYEFNPQIEKAVPVIRKYFIEKVDIVQSIWEETRKLPFFRRKNYVMPLKYVDEFYDDPSALMQHGWNRRVKTPFGAGIERVKGVKKIPRIDIFMQFMEGIRAQERFINLDPVLENTKYLVKDPKYIEKAGVELSTYWADRLDIISRGGRMAGYRNDWIAAVLRSGRLNLNRSILGLRATSALVQPTAVFDAAAFALPTLGHNATGKVVKEFAKSWIKPGYKDAIVKGSKALKVRKGGEIGLAEALQKKAINSLDFDRKKSYIRKLWDDPLKGLRDLDLRTAAGVQQGFENTTREIGAEGSKEEAEFYMMMSQSSTLSSMIPNVLTRGEGLRTWLTFQSFILNRWGILAHDIGASGIIHGATIKQKITALEALGILVAAGFAEEFVRKNVNEFITGKERKEKGTVALLLSSTLSNMPFFGNMLDVALNQYYGASSGPPLVQVINKGIRGIGDIYNGRPVSGLFKGAEAGLTLLGVKGTAQLFDIAERFKTPFTMGGVARIKRVERK